MFIKKHSLFAFSITLFRFSPYHVFIWVDWSKGRLGVSCPYRWQPLSVGVTELERPSNSIYALIWICGCFGLSSIQANIYISFEILVLRGFIFTLIIWHKYSLGYLILAHCLNLLSIRPWGKYVQWGGISKLTSWH